MSTLYKRILGKRFCQLHPVLQEFHSREGIATADCNLTVIHPPVLLKSLFRVLARMPSAGRHEATLLEVHTRNYGEEWIRTIGRRVMVTRQWQFGNLLVEGVGPAAFGIELILNNGSMKFETRRVWMIGIPVPRLIAPRVFAEAIPRETSWLIEVRLEAPLLGSILIYEGEVTPRCSS